MSIIDTIRAALSGPQLKTIGDRTPSLIRGRPVAPSRDINTLLDAYGTNEVVYACVDVMAQACSDPTLVVEARKLGGTFERADFHPAISLLRNPHPLYSATDFIREAIMHMHVAGRFVCEKIRATKNGPPVALWPLDPTKLKPIPGEDGGIEAWEWTGSGSDRLRIPASETIFWQRTDPRNRYQALSPLSVAMGAVAGDTQQTNYINGFFEGGGVPSGILTVKDSMLTDDEVEKVRQDWRAKFRRNFGGNQRDIAVLNQNATYQPLGSKLDEIESEELRSVAESRICMVFGVPPIVIYSYFGLSHSSYANMEEAWSQFWSSKLTPWLKEYRVWLSNTLLREFEDDVRVDNEMVRFNWDMSQVSALADDLEAINARVLAQWTSGLITRNEAREKLGYESVEAGGEDLSVLAPAPAALPEPAKALAAPQKKSLELTPDQLKAIDDGKEKIVARFKVKVEQYLEQQYNAAADAGSADGADDGAQLGAVALPHYRAAVKLAHDDAEAQLAEYTTLGAFDLENPRVRDTIGGLLTRITRVTDTTREEIRGIIADGLEQGLSTTQIAGRIREAAPGMARSRAETIARTETADAYTRGAILAYQDSGVVDEVEWLATLDNRTSEVCTGLNGKRVALGAEFPGGRVGPPAHPNCRSVLIPIVNV